jgi:hypothetical protein
VEFAASAVEKQWTTGGYFSIFCEFELLQFEIVSQAATCGKWTSSSDRKTK